MADRPELTVDYDVADDGAEWRRLAQAVGLPWPPAAPEGPQEPRRAEVVPSTAPPPRGPGAPPGARLAKRVRKALRGLG